MLKIRNTITSKVNGPQAGLPSMKEKVQLEA